MKKHEIGQISTDISVLQNKLGLLRSELYRSQDTHIKSDLLKDEIEEMEKRVDELQKVYGRTKDIAIL